MMTKTIKVLSLNGSKTIPFTIRYVAEGDKYGCNMCLTNDRDETKTTHQNNADIALIEFYDARYPMDKTEDGEVLGQFVGRYYCRTIYDSKAEYERGRGLNLHGGVSDWDVDNAGMMQALRLIDLNQNS